MDEIEIATKLAEVEQRSKSNSHRLEKCEEQLSDNQKMLANLTAMAQRQDTMDGDIKEIKADVKTLTAKPAKRWEGLVEKMLLTVAAALVAFALAKLGLG